MKSTIKLDGGLSLVVSPIKFPKPAQQGGVVLQLNLHDGARIINLTADQCGALMFGFEMCFEVNQVRAAA